MLGGKATIRRGTKTTTVKLGTKSVTAAKTTVTVKLPASVRSALRGKRRTSVTLTLAATTDGGTAKTASGAHRLR